MANCLSNFLRSFTAAVLAGAVVCPPGAHALRPVLDKAGLEEAVREAGAEEEFHLEEITYQPTRQAVFLTLQALSLELSWRGRGEITPAQILQWLAGRPRILDLGAGADAELVRWLRARGAPRVYGFDRVFPRTGPRPDSDLRGGSFQDRWPFGDKLFPLVVSTFALNPEEAPREIPERVYYSLVASELGRVLADDGLAILLVAPVEIPALQEGLNQAGLRVSRLPGSVHLVSHQPIPRILRRMAREIRAYSAGAEEMFENSARKYLETHRPLFNKAPSFTEASAALAWLRRQRAARTLPAMKGAEPLSYGYLILVLDLAGKLPAGSRQSWTFEASALDYAESSETIQGAPSFTEASVALAWLRRQRQAGTLPALKGAEPLSYSYLIQVLDLAGKLPAGSRQSWTFEAGALERAEKSRAAIESEIRRIWQAGSSPNFPSNALTHLKRQFDPAVLPSLLTGKSLSVRYRNKILMYAFDLYGKSLIAQLAGAEEAERLGGADFLERYGAQALEAADPRRAELLELLSTGQARASVIPLSGEIPLYVQGDELFWEVMDDLLPRAPKELAFVPVLLPTSFWKDFGMILKHPLFPSPANPQGLDVREIWPEQVARLDPLELVLQIFRSRLEIPGSRGLGGLLFKAADGQARLVLFSA